MVVNTPFPGLEQVTHLVEQSAHLLLFTSVLMYLYQDNTSIANFATAM